MRPRSGRGASFDLRVSGFDDLVRVLIAPDKFKGTLTAAQAAQAISRGWARIRPDDLISLLPMSDGGDGFGRVIGGLLGARPRRVRTVDAAGRPCVARWWWEAQSRIAVIESATVIGIAMLPRNRFHPFELHTAGLAKVLASAARLEPLRCFVGIGGSATNDAGFGLARALGWRFLDRLGEQVRTWGRLVECDQVKEPTSALDLGELTVAVDVRNPLLGPHGCTRVYGPQKGLGPDDFDPAESALARLADLVTKRSGESVAEIPGAGAAGGLGFGLMAFLGAKPASGFSLFAREAELRSRMEGVDLVITGEGCLDRQSIMGKGVGELGRLCGEAEAPCVAINGRVESWGAFPNPFARVYSMSETESPVAALRNPGLWLSKTAERAAREWPGAG